MESTTDTTVTLEFYLEDGICPVSGAKLGKKNSRFAPGMDARLKSLAIKEELSGNVWGVTVEGSREVLNPLAALKIIGSARLAEQAEEAVKAAQARAKTQAERAERLAAEKAAREAKVEAEKAAKAEARAAAAAEKAAREAKVEAEKAAKAEAKPAKRSRKAKAEAAE
jgi:colicin import membrane protein